MPVYSTIETIKDGFTSGAAFAYTKWKVFDQDDNLMNTFSGLETTTPNDAWSNLETFINKMSGEGYIIIKAYPKEYKWGKGGDTSSVLKFYYRLSEKQNRSGSGFSGGGGISLEMYLGQLAEVNNLRTQLAIKEIEEKLTKKENKDSSYFERVAGSIGKSFAKEYLKKEGIHDEDEDEEEAPKPKKKKASVSGTSEEPAKPEEKEKVKETFKRTGEATVRIMKIAKSLGSDYGAVADSFEDIADLAESNPLKLKELFDKLKEEKE